MSDASENSRTFSDAWHRVSGVRVSLRSSVQAHRQWYQGQRWVVLRDRLSSDWYRVTAHAYAFLCRLSPTVTVDEVWQDMRLNQPDVSLTQDEVVQLLGQMNLSNMLQVDRATPGDRLFARYDERIKRERKAFWMGFLAIRVPLFDPNSLLDRMLPLIRAVLSPIGIILYILLLLAAVFALMQDSERLFSQSAGILAPDNLMLLYIGFVVAKIVHEFGHAGVCKYFGGEVHTIGVMLLIFAPLPYMDASASWGFRSRWQRLFVSMSGVLAELVVAASAALVWVNTAPGTLNALMYNVIFAASVSSFLFNLNPLLRFDGYHALVDVLGMPNLYSRSRQQLTYLLQRFVLRVKNAQPAAINRREVIVLPLYAVTSLIYWVFLMIGIVVLVGTQYLDLGIALAWFIGFTAVVMPLYKALKYLLTSPQLERVRLRAFAISLGILALFTAVLAGYPVADRTRVSGVIQASNFRAMYTEATGEVVKVEAMLGSYVREGDVLLRLENSDLLLRQQANRGALAEVNTQIWRAITESVADVSALEKQRDAILAEGDDLRRQIDALTLRAPIDGIWSVSVEEVALGRWLQRGGSVGQVIDPSSWQFVGVLPQVSTHVFDDTINVAEIKLVGQEDMLLVAQNTTVLSHENDVLPSPALGMAGGGEIAIDSRDANGTKASESFFRVRADVLKPTDQSVLLHGRVAQMRLTLSDRPLVSQWERAIRQFFQRKFRV